MYEVYKILENDNLNSIANKYGVDEDILIQINGLKDKDITNLEYLVVPQNKTPFQYYTVKKGDTIYNISKEYNVDEDLILKLNGLDKFDYIYPDQTIIIPRNNYRLYFTKTGDTISSISNKYNLQIEDIINENRNISLYPEQIIVIKEK